MNLSPVSETFGNQKHDWLASEDGFTPGRPVSIKVSTLTSGTHYPNGYLPDGLAIAVPTSGANAGYGVPLAARPNEQQTVTITGTPTGGTFTLTLDGETTAGIAFNANAAAVTTALENLSNVRVGSVAVTGGPGPGTPWVVTFSGTQYQGTDVPQMTASGASLTGGSSPAANVSTSTAGGSGQSDGSDVLAGFLKFPVAVPAGATVVLGAYMWRGAVYGSKLPIALTAAQVATNSMFKVF